MPDDGRPPAASRRLETVAAGHRGDEDAARAGTVDDDPAVRAAALGSLGRIGALTADDLRRGLSDDSSEVRRRAAQESVRLGPPALDPLLATAADPEPLVVEMVCWALGELALAGAVPTLGELATAHPDPRCREVAVAALGALAAEGLTGGRDAVLRALSDRPPVRRRAVVALAAFDGPEVEAALRRSLEDRDWQVRQAAETLLDP